MVNVDDAVIARLKKSGKTFEILVDCDKALDYKEGDNLNDILATNEIYEDVKKAKPASQSDLEETFSTNNSEEIAIEILKRGEVQLTAEYQKKLAEQKRRQIITLISRNAVDPTSGRPHPPQRIENAMNEAKVKIVQHKSAEEQMQDIVKQLRPIIPISFEMRELEIKFTPKHAGRASSVLRQYSKVLKEEWKSDGSLTTLVELPAGQQESLEIAINSFTHGDIELKILRSK